MKVILTCEHAGNEIPEQYRELFKHKSEILNSHRGYDPGAHDVFKHLLELSEQNYFQLMSRLLVEVNRSVGHPKLFSEFTNVLPPAEKKEILKKFYYPYRNSAEKTISKLLSEGEEVLHFSVHSFTPKLNKEIRNADIGLLYDPSRKSEKEFCRLLKQQLLAASSKLKVRFNYPYLGISDGFTTYLRRKFAKNYLGIELEINQNFELNKKMPNHLKQAIYLALQGTIKDFSKQEKNREDLH